MTAGWPACDPPAWTGAGAALMALPSFLPAGHRSAGATLSRVPDKLEQLQGQAEVLAGPAQVHHAEAGAHRERPDIVRLHDRYHAVQVASAESQRDRAAGGLGRVPVSPVLRIQVPADLHDLA